LYVMNFRVVRSCLLSAPGPDSPREMTLRVTKLVALSSLTSLILCFVIAWRVALAVLQSLPAMPPLASFVCAWTYIIPTQRRNRAIHRALTFFYGSRSLSEWIVSVDVSLDLYTVYA
jgi:hypothetical protein